MARRRRDTALPAPFLKRITLRDPDDLPEGYPFDLPWLNEAFELSFDSPVTIFCGENGTGKSTLIEAIAACAGYDDAGGGKGYRAVDHSEAREINGGHLAPHLRAGWLPKVTDGWFFRAESFFSVARYLDAVSSPAADFLSHSHGEGFLRLFDERMGRQGFYLMDEPESALSPRRQLDLLSLLAAIQEGASSQVILATHSPLLMAVPGAALWGFSRGGIVPISLSDTTHFKLYRAFIRDPEGFADQAVRGDLNDIP
ncbi:MAG: AAA family ATPase [Pseudomonadota bacterium]